MTEKIEIFETAAAELIDLDNSAELILTEARKPQHYIKRELTPKTAPNLFNSRTSGDKACLQIMLDDGRIIAADLVRVERQSITIFAVNTDSSPSSIAFPLKKRVW